MDSSLEQEENESPREAESDDLLKAVKAAILIIQDKLAKTGGEKGSITDLVRLLQLRKELEGELPRHISVRWIDECLTSID